ncbi:histidine phosphatase family protein [Niameybacter massiliensis]|uniref:histidine phosphatase family protein n=1 Tax=Niameybacter massiliensis TaxID=1658108 RepID=UPI0006B4701A|nr:histidine phosphatase family protein [Niameybacter massiliensis]
MKTTIYLTRHGQTEWNIEKRLQGRGNSPLTQEGIQKAEELKERLKDLNIDVIYSSPIERALHTAHILKGDKSVEVITCDGLMEMGFGEYEGRKTEEITKENPEWNINLIMEGHTTMSAPGGENLEEVRDRVRQAMDEIIEVNKGKEILIVAHGITLKALMYYFKDQDVNQEVMGQTTLTKIECDEKGECHIIFKNDDTHFTNKTKQLGW